MFNPEKLLGSLLKGGLSRGGMGSNMKVQVGMGLLGLAIGAVEHFTNKPPAQPPSAPYDPRGAVPPPAPPGMTAPPPPPGPPPVQAGEPARPNQAVLLIRAMIAAASADGVIDQQERQRILEKYRGANLSQEEQNFLAGELLCPAGVEQLTAEAHSVETARRIYAVPCLPLRLIPRRSGPICGPWLNGWVCPPKSALPSSENWGSRACSPQQGRFPLILFRNRPPVCGPRPGF